MCVGSSRSVWATLGLPLLTVCVLSQSTLLRLQVALQGNSLKPALGCMHFPGLSHSGSGSRALYKGTDSAGPAFCALPRLSSSGDQVLGECTLPRWGSVSFHLPGPSHLVSWVHKECCLRCALCLLWGADLWLRASWWMPTIQDPRKTWLTTGRLVAPRLLVLAVAHLPLCLRWGMGQSTAS